MNDIHTHLYWHTYDADRDAVVARARAAGVGKMLVIGCTVDESRQAIAIAEQYENVYAAVGIHPHFFNELVEKEFSISNFQFSIKSKFFNDTVQKLTGDLGELAKHENVVAIGECGLDYYSHELGRAVTDEQKVIQRAGFVAQIALAQELGLPLILHCRTDQGKSDAYEDMFGILSEVIEKASEAKEAKKLKAVLHCYMGDAEVTKQFLTLPDVFFSFTGNITYPIKKAVAGTKDDLTETVKLVPLERIFTETDCPFLSPQSHRGERNEPAYVSEVAAKIAELHGTDAATIERVTEENFHKVFKI